MSNRKSGDTFVFEKVLLNLDPSELICGLIVSPCKVTGNTGTKEIVEICPVEEAEFWSVYAEIKDGNPVCIADCTSEIAAKCLVTFLTSFKNIASF